MNVPCTFCEQEASLFFRTTDLNREISAETFDYYRCRACGLIFLHPVPANLGDYYPTSYYGFASSAEALAETARPEQYKVDIVRRFKPEGGRLLEVGPGGGGFVCLSKLAGYEVEAIEMDGDVCRYLADVLGVRAINSADVAEALRGSEEPYDVIAMWHNIEHLPDPWAAFDEAARRLRPGGILVIAAPNPDSLQFRLFGRYWTHLDAPRHLALIPIPLLERRAARHGMKTLLKTTTDEGTLGWNVFGWRESLPHRINFSWRLKQFSRRLAPVITLLMAPAERTGHRGSAYTLVFQKGGASDV